MNKTLKLALAACLLATLQACNGIFDGIYDAPESDEKVTIGFGGDKDGTRFQLTLNASGYDNWIYIDLHNRTLETRQLPDTLTTPHEWDGKSQWTYYNVHGNEFEALRSIPTLPQQEAEEWDIAIHHFDVKTNGGAALETDFGSIDDAPQSSEAFTSLEFTADQWTTHQCISDFSGMLSYNIWYASGYVNPVLSSWVKMDLTTPPPSYSASNKMYVLRLKDGTHAALRLLSYQSEAGTKGFLTIDVKYPY